MRGLIFCENCEVSVARWRCRDCDDQRQQLTQSPTQGGSSALTLCFFCSDCQALHSKLKMFKTHSFEDITSTFSHRCCNCEERDAKYMCKECPEVDRYLCLGCSVLHPKVKAFKNHNVVPIFNDLTDGGLNRLNSSQDEHDNRFSAGMLFQRVSGGINDFLNFSSAVRSSSNANEPLLPQFQGAFVEMMDAAMSLNISRPSFWTSSFILFLLLAVYFFLVKLTFGNNSMSVHILLIFVIVYANHNKTREIQAKEKELVSESIEHNRAILRANDKGRSKAGENILQAFAKEFPNEFPYEQATNRTESRGGTGPRRPIFRPRSRAYAPRGRSVGDQTAGDGNGDE